VAKKSVFKRTKRTTIYPTHLQTSHASLRLNPRQARTRPPRASISNISSPSSSSPTPRRTTKRSREPASYACECNFFDRDAVSNKSIAKFMANSRIKSLITQPIIFTRKTLEAVTFDATLRSTTLKSTRRQMNRRSGVTPWPQTISPPRTMLATSATQTSHLTLQRCSWGRLSGSSSQTIR
jgi:hypothetical protein